MTRPVIGLTRKDVAYNILNWFKEVGADPKTQFKGNACTMGDYEVRGRKYHRFKWYQYPKWLVVIIAGSILFGFIIGVIYGRIWEGADRFDLEKERDFLKKQIMKQ